MLAISTTAPGVKPQNNVRRDLKGYLSVQEAARKCGTSVRGVNQYILEGRIPVSERVGHAWTVPKDAGEPERSAPGVKAKRSTADETP